MLQLNTYVVCLKSSVNGTKKQTKQKINFIGLQNNNRHTSQHTVGNIYKTSGNCQQRPAITHSWIAALIPKEAFADSFQKFYERCQQCVVKDGDYFEGQ
jgi:hypothetical protein